MAETRGITVKIDAELHSRVKAEVEALGLTMGQYIEQVLTEHFKLMEGAKRDMGPIRTLAFQVSEDLFQRVKDYLRKTGITQKDFVIGLIEDELERFEMSEKEQSEDGEDEGPDEDEDLEADEDDDEDFEEDLDEGEESEGQYVPESPQEGTWEADQGSDEGQGEDAADGPQEAGVDDEGEARDDEYEDFVEQKLTAKTLKKCVISG